MSGETAIPNRLWLVRLVERVPQASGPCDLALVPLAPVVLDEPVDYFSLNENKTKEIGGTGIDNWAQGA